MFALIDLIKQYCKNAINLAYPELHAESIEVTEATNLKFGDYQLNSAMRFAKILKVPPITIANNIVKNFNKDIFRDISIAGAGFINLTLKTDFLANNIELFLKNNKFIWGDNKKPSITALIDFSSPNIAKEMHVGHLRSTLIGDCLARVLEFCDYQVLRINHIGDWGTQFGMLIAYLKINNKLNNKNNKNNKLDNNLLLNYYKQAKNLFDNDHEFKAQAQKEVVKLQSGDKDNLAIWNTICSISMEAYQKIYDLLDIKITNMGESSYNNMLPLVIKDFTDHKLLQNSDGAKCIYLPGFINKENNPLPLMIQKSDGGYNYATTDLAAIKYRVNEQQANWLIYVTDKGQMLHFNMLFAAARLVGYLDDNKYQANHVSFGLVLRQDGKKFKTREGDTEKLQDLIDRAILKAKNLLLLRDPKLNNNNAELIKLSKIMGINAIKYADLSNNRNSDYVFDYDKMLQFNGNTASFLSYAYVRINSIKNKINIDINKLNNKLQLETKEEQLLALRICKFQDALKATLKDLMPNRLTDYLYSLAEEFHAFFHVCRVDGSELQNSRLLLCEAVLKILETGFNLLGLKTIERM